MTWVVRVIPDADRYEAALDAPTRALFEKDKAKIAANPYAPSELKSRPYKAGNEDLRTASCARGKLLVQYRIYQDLVEIHILKIMP